MNCIFENQFHFTQYLPVHMNPVTRHTSPTPSNHYSPKVIIYVAYLICSKDYNDYG
jgi:hypothetical protein